MVIRFHSFARPLSTVFKIQAWARDAGDEHGDAHVCYSFSQSVFYFLSHRIATRKVPAELQVKRVRSQPLVISSTASGGSTSAAATE